MKTVNFTKISIQNFLSVGEDVVTVEFNRGLHVLTGINIDKPERKNAVGKSTVADALYFAIFGETLRGIKKDLITNNITGGKTHVELEFDVDTSQGSSKYSIIRTLLPTKVYVYKDGVDETRDSIANTTKYICDILSASPAVFQNCVIMTVNNAIPFMAKNKTEKRRFIEDIFGMEVFSKMISVLRSDYNDVKRLHDADAIKLEEIDTSLRGYIGQKNNSLEKKQNKHNLYLTRQLANEKEIVAIQQLIAAIPDSNITEKYTKQITDLEASLVTVEDLITQLVEECTKQKTVLNHRKDQYVKIGSEESKCPVCLRSIEDHDKQLIEQERNSLKENIVSIAACIKSLLHKINVERDRKDKIKGLITKSTTLLHTVNQQVTSKANLENSLLKLTNWQQELSVDIESLNSDTDDFDDLINKTQERQVEISNKLQIITKQLGKLDIVKFIVSEEGVKSYIVNKLLELLNNKLFFYLKKLDSNSVCVFNEYFEEEIVNDQNKVCSYFNFSGAERKSIDLACLFAFSDIRRLQGGVSYNIAIYDELFDSSFDNKGIELITEILKERSSTLNECTIVISHRKESLKAVTGDIIFLEKRNGITRRVAYSED
jgi:DNA repair exonuclease SbcCD ATPase subunit